jgi:hypothetical protein
MDAQDGLSEHIAGTLAAFGVEVNEVDAAVIDAAWQGFGPEMRELLEADLEAVEPEPDLDPSKPPR